MRDFLTTILLRRRRTPPPLSRSSSEDHRLAIVTGADTSHYKSLCHFLSSLIVHDADVQVVAFDLGLTAPEREYLTRTFPSVELRRFDFPTYPAYFNIKEHAGQYAWKPVIFHEVLHEFRCCVCWMDAGNVVTEPLTKLREIAATNGMYSPESVGLISDWTHPKTLSFLHASRDLLDLPNLNGACVAMCYRNRKARKLARRWRKCALTKECIAPEGSSRENHRQDQAVLSVIAHQSGITKDMPTGFYGFWVHQDVD